MRTWLLGFVILVAEGGCDRPTVRGGPDGAGRADLAPPGCSDVNPCPAGRRCYQAACIPDNGTCQSDNECQNDSYCDCSATLDGGTCASVCVPYGVGPRPGYAPECEGLFTPEAFRAPIVKCQWQDAAPQGSLVLSTPLVIDLDRDGAPEIVFTAGLDEYAPMSLVALRGSDCSEVWRIPNLPIYMGTQLAAGDLDGDGAPEIVALAVIDTADPANDVGVWVFDKDGTQVAAGTMHPGIDLSGIGARRGNFCSGPAIADLDGQAPAEIVVGGSVLRYTKGNPNLALVFEKKATPSVYGTMSALADLDEDGVQEIVVGYEIYDGATGASKTPPALAARYFDIGSYPAIADFNLDGKADIVEMDSLGTGFFIFDYSNDRILLGPIRDNTGGGPPTVGDYDGDGAPDVGVAKGFRYTVYSLRCLQTPKPADCKASGVLWERDIYDISSGSTSSFTFDFNGDRVAEVVLRDECWLRIMNGPDGKTLAAYPITSGTALENPVVADVDGDGHAEIVVGSDSIQGGDYCDAVSEDKPNDFRPGSHPPGTWGLYVLADPYARWMGSRPLWNQHTYHITNVNDDLSIPVHESPNWKTFNDYRKNVQGIGMPDGSAPDYTAGVATAVDNGGASCEAKRRLWANLCNRGVRLAAAGVPGSFYNADPRTSGAMRLCSTATKAVLNPGECEPVSCDWSNPPLGPRDIWFRANDDGSGLPPAPECHGGNDILFLERYDCAPVG